MAHSYIQAHDDELEAFERFARLYPGSTILVDTYDTIGGVEKVVELSRRLGRRFRINAIRLDSGNLLSLSKAARERLDAAGLRNVKIFASSSLDEYEIKRLLDRGAPIDGFGVGTKFSTSADAPHLDMAYKLVDYAGSARMKLSPSKVLYPGMKQVFIRLRSATN